VIGSFSPQVPPISPTALWMKCVRYPFCSYNDELTILGSDYSEEKVMPYLRKRQDNLLILSERLGSLSCTLSGDGKRRLFAIGNYFKQRLLYPFHAFLMSVLRKIPMDGTFDQRAPIRRLRGSPGVISSVDLNKVRHR
jgi:hypothetical protein